MLVEDSDSLWREKIIHMTRGTTHLPHIIVLEVYDDTVGVFDEKPRSFTVNEAKYVLDSPSLIISFIENPERVQANFGHLGFQVETSEEISIISQSQLITKWLKSLISSDLYKKAGDVEIRNKIISLVEQNSSQIEEIYNLIKKPNKLELAIFKNIRETILQMRVELVVTPLPELITNPDITNPDIPNISLDTVQKSDIPSNPDI